ncbi:MAG: hypothetical protein AABY22_24380 [Nanoarchaeota archaeon]
MLNREEEEKKVRQKDYYYKNNKKNHQKLTRKYYLENRDVLLNYAKKWRDKKVIEENKRREELGLPRIGDKYRKETEMYVIVRKLFPNIVIVKHARKIIGNNLEFDVFIPSLKIAFEYNGKQHYDKKTFDFINKDKYTFDRYIALDNLKKELCQKEGIKLFIVKYDEKLNEDTILNKLKSHQEELYGYK